MEQIETSNKTTMKSASARRLKRLSTKIDLTPMVDLGFLLITFFIFTTTMSKATVVKLSVPKDSEQFLPIKKSGALTILLKRNDQIRYFFGSDSTNSMITNYHDLRQVILAKKKATTTDDLFIIIRPEGDASYENTMNVLNEMTINDIRRYTII